MNDLAFPCFLLTGRPESVHPGLRHRGPASREPVAVLPLPGLPDHPPLPPERPLDPVPGEDQHLTRPGQETTQNRDDVSSTYLMCGDMVRLQMSQTGKGCREKDWTLI